MQITSNFKALIFDMDGTLIDSEPVGPSTFLQLAKKYGVSPDENEIKSFSQSWKRVGNYINEEILMITFVSNHGLKVGPSDFVNEFFDTYISNLINAPALTGVTEFLHQAKVKGFKLVIVSASKSVQIQATIGRNGWQKLIDFIVGEEDISKHKPNPEGYLIAIHRLKLLPEECIVFEDSENGVIAAKAAGTYVIGLREGNSEIMNLSSADEVLNNFTEVGFGIEKVES